MIKRPLAFPFRAASAFLAAAGMALMLAAQAGPALAAGMSAEAFMTAVNGDADKTLSMAEVDAYAKKRFAEIESDHDKTLDEKELKDRMSAAGMASADTDKDKTVDEAEFVGYADTLFKEANTKGNKTLSLAELKSAAGEKLIMLLH